MSNLIAVFSDYTFRTVALGAAYLGMVSGVVGSFTVLRRQSLLGDGVSHAALPGVVLAFLLTGSKHPLSLQFGALIFGLLAIGLITLITRFSRIKFDGALALIMSSFFGLGMVLLTYVQKIPNSQQAGLRNYIFGQASTLLARDLQLMFIVGTVLILLIVLFWKEFKLFAFDPEYSETVGFSPRLLNTVLSFIVVVTIITGLQTVGVVLMSALLIAPAVAARQWTNKLSVMVSLAAILGGVSGIIGTTISSLYPRVPTGPAIVLSISIITLLSLLFAPERGIVSRMLLRRRQIQEWGGGLK